MTTQTSYFHFYNVNSVWTDWSFKFLKNVSAFQMLIKDQLFKDAIVIYLLLLSLNLDQA